MLMFCLLERAHSARDRKEVAVLVDEVDTPCSVQLEVIGLTISRVVVPVSDRHAKVVQSSHNSIELFLAHTKGDMRKIDNFGRVE